MEYTYAYPRAAITADAVILKEIEEQTMVLLIQRASPPFQGMWALPGGFMDMDETLEECAARETEEETGLKGLDFIQIGAFSAIDRDPRHRTITVAFLARANESHHPKAGSDASNTRWFPLNDLPPLAFDHGKIIAAAF
ncbi:MAG: NUDIX hydrolase [Bacteroides sp.]|jgi:8-oxo-dGTP diphosphatase|nr:NUDIX hydrolase [Bacteroides sp.]